MLVFVISYECLEAPYYLLEDRSIEIIHSERKEDLKNPEQHLSELWDNIKRSNMCIWEPRREEREREGGRKTT